jgi:Na+-translocating ferredoxin:NAD+ oxidoreductase RnfA subunit
MSRIRSSHSLSSLLPPVELRSPLLAGSGVFVASWLFLSYVPAFAVWLYGDVRFYENWGSMMAGHLVPYRDFHIEYPPGALTTFLAPTYLRKLAGYHGTYYDWFRVEILVIGLASIVVMAWALAFLGAARRRAYASLCLGGVGAALLGPIALSRYDYWPALCGVGAVAALAARRPVLACGLSAVGAAAKVYPVVLVPLALIELWRRKGARGVAEGVALAVGVVAALTAPFAAVAPHGLSWALHRELVRPLQVESLGAVFFAAAHEVANVHLHVVKSFGSDNLVGSGPDLAVTLSSVATAAALLGVYLLYARSGHTREQLVAASAAAVTAYIAFSKVFSPQYLIWLIPLVPLVGGRRGLRASVLLAVVLGMTQIWEPYRYYEYYRTFTPWLTWLVIVRDLLVVVLFAVLVWPSGRNAQQLDPLRAPVV